ncbi:MAG: hypothetical protein A3F90_17645 [Deltaproteobacteria bacterium RIFCSPLOWO2_12_FULL_60_19]|nr:MAG: hypothetical protein A3F90_17645 [Deltaproteobacteria bacterium RIFCSPLOWO2_12_FULL_60_19]
MKNIIKLLLVPVALFAFVGTGFAQGTTPAPAKPAAPAKQAAPAKTTEKKEATVKVNRARGELLAVDSKAGTAKVKGRDGEMSLIADTKETKDALTKVKVGDPVRFMYTEKDGKLVLARLEKGRVRTESKSSRQKTQKPQSTTPTK